jgi:hypothetical protein
MAFCTEQLKVQELELNSSVPTRIRPSGEDLSRPLSELFNARADKKSAQLAFQPAQ